MPTSTTTILTQQQQNNLSNGSGMSGVSMNGANNSSTNSGSAGEDLQQQQQQTHHSMSSSGAPSSVVSLMQQSSTSGGVSSIIGSSDLSLAINTSTVSTSQILDDDLGLNGTLTTSPTNHNNSLSNNNNNSHTTNNNLLIESSDLDELNLKAGDLNCLNPGGLLNGVSISSASSMLMSSHPNNQSGGSASGLSSGFNVDHSPWSTAGDEPSHMPMNGLHGFQNYTPNSLFNGSTMAQALQQQQQQQQQRRAITASHTNPGFGPHGLSPNNMGRTTPHLQNPNQQNQCPPQISQQFKNPYPAWSQAPSNSGPSGGPQSQQQQHQQQQQQQMNQMWNSRGRSAPNMNPMPGMPHSNRKPHPGQHNLSPFGAQGSSSPMGQAGAISPSKYRRNASFPGKNMQQQQGQGQYHGSAGVGNIPDCTGLGDVGVDPFMAAYQSKIMLTNKKQQQLVNNIEKIFCRQTYNSLTTI
uniref:CSON012717 protein n=1 Tax=Culicoides sonorensis TaxID=179676 RepID=A0A336LK48_CULSO